MDYLPKEESLLIEWLENFSKAIEEIGHEVGIPEAEIQFINTLIKSFKNDINRYELGINNDIILKSFNKNALIKNVKEMINKIQCHSLYLESSHGKRLGLVKKYEFYY